MYIFLESKENVFKNLMYLILCAHKFVSIERNITIKIGKFTQSLTNKCCRGYTVMC